MQRAVWLVRTLLTADDAASAMEYGLLLGLVALVVAGALVSVAGQIGIMFDKISTCVTSASC